ncbi:MAG: hypothetical protein OEZ40_07200 [Candidatus Bathyarchaeota archaeon]|nr:hypothetical protein [Candidatus Bathyarchaeota archaeon]
MSLPHSLNAETGLVVCPRTSSTETLAKQTLTPNENGKQAEFKEFWRKKS